MPITAAITTSSAVVTLPDPIAARAQIEARTATRSGSTRWTWCCARPAAATAGQLRRRMDGHVLDVAELIGTCAAAA